MKPKFIQNILTNQIKPYVDTIRSIFQNDSWQHLAPCDVLLVRHDNDCGYSYHGQAYAPIIDTLGELCEKRGLIVRSIATPHSRLIGKKAYHSPVSYNQSFSLINILGIIVSILHGSGNKREWTTRHHVHRWCRILEKSTPKYVIGIQPDEHLCKAGKLKQIPVYDLQHGVIANDDPYYGEIYRFDTLNENLPDGFLCWDHPSASTILKWAKKKEIQVSIIGNPWFLRFYWKHLDDVLVNEAVPVDNNIIADEQPVIIVSLQWGMIADECLDDVSDTIMGETLVKVISDTKELYNWVIRLHPIQLRGTEKEMVLNYLRTTFGTEKTLRWFMGSKIPLPIVLNKADLHITYHSSVVKEAAWMGVHSGLLCKQLNNGGKYQDLFTYERHLDMAEIIPQNPDAIKQWIVDTLAKGHGQSTLKDSGKNLDAFINEIAGRK